MHESEPRKSQRNFYGASDPDAEARHLAGIGQQAAQHERMGEGATGPRGEHGQGKAGKSLMNQINISFDERVNQLADMMRKNNGTLNRKDVVPGASWWATNHEETIVGLRFACPCGCGDIGFVPVLKVYGGSTWHWDG